MKRMLLCVALGVVAVVAIPVVAGASHSEGQGGSPKFQKANGTGESPTYGEIHVNADDNGRGQDLGHFFFIQGPSEVQGDVTCLETDGEDRAVAGGIVRESNNPMFPPGSAVVFGVEDNDEAGGGDETDRHFRDANGFPPPRDQDCHNAAEFLRFAPPIAQPVEGNYIVHAP